MCRYKCDLSIGDQGREGSTTGTPKTTRQQRENSWNPFASDKANSRIWKLVVLDSGFCVLQGLVELKKLGVFAHALTNKRRYWSKHVKGDDIIQHFANKEVGSADALRGQLDGVPVYIYGMKEPDYTMMLMATYGTSAEQGDEKARNFMDGGSKVVKKFKYPEVVYNHYQFRDVINNNNSMRMSPISMEETWMTSQWANRVFCFLLAVMVVNIQNAGCYFLNLMKVDALKARKLIAEQLIHNKYLRKPDKKCMSQRKNTNADCHLIALPPHKKFKQSKEVFDNTKYNHWKCTCGDARVRTYCQCTPITFYCVNIMQRTALRRIDAITKRSRIQLFLKASYL